MDKNVLLSLLSLDAYNRVYGRRIKISERGGTASRIGDAVIQNQNLADLPPSWQSTDFYASDYVVGANPIVSGLSAGDKIISYRGTDKPSNDFWSFGLGAGDPYNLLNTSYGDNVGLTVDFISRGLLGDPTGDDITNGYGVAFGFPDGDTVISYRGTDRNLTWPNFSTEGSDLVNGYGLALGLFDEPQPNLALDFYKAVIGAVSDPFTANDNIIERSVA